MYVYAYTHTSLFSRHFLSKLIDFKDIKFYHSLISSSLLKPCSRLQSEKTIFGGKLRKNPCNRRPSQGECISLLFLKQTNKPTKNLMLGQDLQSSSRVGDMGRNSEVISCYIKLKFWSRLTFYKLNKEHSWGGRKPRVRRDGAGAAWGDSANSDSQRLQCCPFVTKYSIFNFFPPFPSVAFCINFLVVK